MKHFKTIKQGSHFYVIRHAQSTFNVDPSVAFKEPEADWRLTDDGIAQAFLVGMHLKEVLQDVPKEQITFYASTHQRAEHTARIIREVALTPDDFQKVVCARGIREMEWAANTKEPEQFKAERIAYELDPLGYKWIRGESQQDVWKRVNAFLETHIFRQHNIIVTHDITSKHLIAALLGDSIENTVNVLPLQNAGIREIIINKPEEEAV